MKRYTRDNNNYYNDCEIKEFMFTNQIIWVDIISLCFFLTNKN